MFRTTSYRDGGMERMYLLLSTGTGTIYTCRVDYCTRHLKYFAEFTESPLAIEINLSHAFVEEPINEVAYPSSVIALQGFANLCNSFSDGTEQESDEMYLILGISLSYITN